MTHSQRSLDNKCLQILDSYIPFNNKGKEPYGDTVIAVDQYVYIFSFSAQSHKVHTHSIHGNAISITITMIDFQLMIVSIITMNDG